MRQITRWIWIAMAPALIASCAVSDAPTTEDTEAVAGPPRITAGTGVATEAIPEPAPTVFSENRHVHSPAIDALDDPCCACCHNLGGDDVTTTSRRLVPSTRGGDRSSALSHDLPAMVGAGPL
jgi:hypothetical protein